MRAKHRTLAAMPLPAAHGQRFPPLAPLPRCRCGQCRECRENDRWDRIFARFEAKHYGEERGLFQSTLRGF